MIQEISKTIRLFFDRMLGTTKVIVEKAKPYANLYIKGLIWLLMIAIISPIPFLAIGIIGDYRWLIALTGLWWAFWFFLLSLAASPIGILIEGLTGGIEGSGQRYVKWVSGILLVGLCISLFASIIPIKENPAMLPGMIVAALILGIINVWLFTRKVITPLVSIIFIALILSFYFPTTFKILGEKISGIDISMAEPERLYPTYESIEKGEFKFFGPDGKAKVWHYRTKDGRFELFNRKGPHPNYKEELKPITPDIVFQIQSQLKAERERSLQQEQEQRKQEEALKLEQQRKEEEKRLEQQKLNEARKIEEERVAQKEEAFLNQYLQNRSFTNRPESLEVAVFVIDKTNNKISYKITQNIASLLKTKGFNPTTSLFSNRVVSDGIFEKIFNGDAINVRSLELSKYIDYIILGKKSVNFTTISDQNLQENMFTAEAVIEIHIVSVKIAIIVDSFTMSEVDAGFSQDTAEEMAMKKIFEKLNEKNWEIIN